MKVAVVVPTCRPERMAAWKRAWRAELRSVGAKLFVVEDSAPTWQRIREDLGDRAHCISIRTDGIRCYGFLLALRWGAEVIVTLDDDVLPNNPAVTDLLALHLDNLEHDIRTAAWGAVGNVRTRGQPFRNTKRTQPCAISHGLWTGTPDYDAATQLHAPQVAFKANAGPVQPGQYIPLSAMNLAFTREIAPAFWWPHMGIARVGYDRYGDIWAGLVAQRIAMHLGMGAWSGTPLVRHERASDVFVNATKEAGALAANETLWERLDDLLLTADSVLGCLAEIDAAQLPELHGLSDWLAVVSEACKVR